MLNRCLKNSISDDIEGDADVSVDFFESGWFFETGTSDEAAGVSGVASGRSSAVRFLFFGVTGEGVGVCDAIGGTPIIDPPLVDPDRTLSEVLQEDFMLPRRI